MIGKLIKGSDAAGLLAYITAPKDSSGVERELVVRVGGTIPGETRSEMLPHFEMLAGLRPTLGIRVAHAMLRWTKDDRPSIADQSAMAERHAGALGYQHWVAFSHGDHVHIAASRINADGTVVSDASDWKRAEQSVRNLEVKFGLVRIECSHLLDPSKSDTHKYAPTAAELGAARHGKPSLRLQLHIVIDAALSDRPTFSRFVGRLQASGVEVRPNIQSTGRVAGISFLLDGMEFKGSRLGKAYSWTALQRKGLDYELERDGNLARECVLRCSTRGNSARNGSCANGDGIDPDCDAQDHRRLAENDNAASCVNRQLDRGSQGDLERIESRGAIISECGPNHRPEAASRARGSGATDGNESGKTDHGAILPFVGNPRTGEEGRGLRGGDRSATASIPLADGSNSRLRGVAPSDVGNIGPFRSGAGGRSGNSAGGVVSDGGPLEVIDGSETAEEALRKWARNAARALRALQGTGAVTTGAHIPPHLPTFPSLRGLAALAGTSTANDPTTKQVRAQVRAFACAQFEVGILPPRHRQDLRPERIRVFTAEKLCEPRTIAWLKRMNSLDRDIYCRPAQRQDGALEPLIFVDDLSGGTVAKMLDNGLPMAICVESSPAMFHGWVRVSDRPISRAEAQAIARELARRYGGDPGAAAWNQFGRLAGYTNRKQSRRTPRGAPFARLHVASPEVAPSGAALFNQIREQLDRNQLWNRREFKGDALAKATSRPLPLAAAAFGRAREHINVRRPDGTRDESVADFGAACSLLRQGFNPEDAIVALLEMSPEISQRHKDTDSYARRTVEAAEKRVSGVRSAISSTLPAPRPR